MTITRKHGNLEISRADCPVETRQLEAEGWTHLKSVFSEGEIEQIKTEINAVFASSGADRDWDTDDQFRHGMFNHSAACQTAIGHPRILETIEPLLGEDCHVIANTAWRNVDGYQGGPWHIDAGPHIPRPEGVPWDDRIPYPIFAIGAHIYLKDCPVEAGPTAVVPGSHKSGRTPPHDAGDALSFEGNTPHLLIADAGDVALFVSDVWHRGTPGTPGYQRFFLQAHYGRRDVAQRVRMTSEVNHVSDEAAARASTERQKTLIGLHKPFFYDA